MFKVGQRVWDINYGWGKITQIRGGGYPLVVDFEGGNNTYTSEGKACSWSKGRSLFFEEIHIPESALTPPRWKAEAGEKVFIIDSLGCVSEMTAWPGISLEGFFNVGNYFQTAEEARASKIYKAFHENDY